MEGSSSKPSDQNQTADGVSRLLAGLPSRGLFSSTFPSSSLGGMRVYICEHDTAPPEDQQIKTNQQNILIRSLTLRKQKTDSSSKAAAASDGSRKRNAEKALDGRSSAKRANSGSSSRQGGVTSFPADYNFQSLTVERLRALLKERGLSVKGKKDELIARLRAANN